MRIRNVTRLLVKAIKKEYEKEKDKIAWDLYVSIYPYIVREILKPISYEDFKKSLFKDKNKVTEISYEEVENEISKVIEAYERKEVK